MKYLKYLYLVLAIIGLVLPYFGFVPFLQENGLNLSLLVKEMFATDISTFFSWDVIVSAAVLIIFIAYDPKRKNTKLWWLSLIGLFTVGVSFAFPLYLFLREK